jgi:predicted metal-dependent phosphoesterase TrpH
LVAAAAKRQLDVIAITDHDTLRGAGLPGAAGESRCALRIIVGEERTLADRSHVIGLFLHEPLFGDTLPVVCEEIAAQEGICVIPHPYRVISGALREHGPELRKACFEIFNPRCSQEEIARRNRSNNAAGSRSAGATRMAMLDGA